MKLLLIAVMKKIRDWLSAYIYLPRWLIIILLARPVLYFLFGVDNLYAVYKLITGAL